MNTLNNAFRNHIDIMLTDQRASIQSHRAVYVGRLMTGRSVDEVPSLFESLYSTCGVAHGIAAALALHDEQERWNKNPVYIAMKRIQLRWEWLRESIIRLLSGDFESLIGGSISSDTQQKVMAALNRQVLSQALMKASVNESSRCARKNEGLALQAVVREAECLVDRLIFNNAMQEFLTIDAVENISKVKQLNSSMFYSGLSSIEKRNWSALGDSRSSFLADYPSSDLRREIQENATTSFELLPTVGGAPQETTVYSRNVRQPLVAAATALFGNGLYSRWLAKFVDIAVVFKRIKGLIDALIAGDEKTLIDDSTSDFSVSRGTAVVEASRGLLLHCTKVEDGFIEHYRIVAPTEWNFHPQGIVAQSLNNVLQSVGNSGSEALKTLVLLFDPCVPVSFKLGANHA